MKDTDKQSASEPSLEAQKFQIEKMKAELEVKLSEQKLLLEPERLQLERDKLSFEQSKIERSERFINKNAGTIITALISLAAVVVSLSQVWVAYISKTKELSVIEKQKQRDNELLLEQKTKELSNLEAQQQRDWELNLTKFVAENSDKIFSLKKDQRERMQIIISTTFPEKITKPLFQKFEKAAPTNEIKHEWRRARDIATQKPSDDDEYKNDDGTKVVEAKAIRPVTIPLTKGSLALFSTPNALVKLTPLNGIKNEISAQTDSQGILTMNNLMAGSYKLVVEYPDREDIPKQESKITIQKGRITAYTALPKLP